MTAQCEKAEFLPVFLFNKKKVSAYSHKAAFLSIKAILLHVSVQRTDRVKTHYH